MRYLPLTCLPCRSLNESKNLLHEKTTKPQRRNKSSLLPPTIPRGSHVLAAISSLACIEKASEVGTLDHILCTLTASVNAAASNVKQKSTSFISRNSSYLKTEREHCTTSDSYASCPTEQESNASSTCPKIQHPMVVLIMSSRMAVG